MKDITTQNMLLKIQISGTAYSIWPLTASIRKTTDQKNLEPDNLLLGMATWNVIATKPLRQR